MSKISPGVLGPPRDTHVRSRPPGGAAPVLCRRLRPQGCRRRVRRHRGLRPAAGRPRGWALARGHACTGRATLISRHLGSGGEFDKAIAEVSVAYAEQNEKDYQALLDVVAAGRIQTVMGLSMGNPRPRLTGPLLRRAPGPRTGSRARVAWRARLAADRLPGSEHPHLPDPR